VRGNPLEILDVESGGGRGDGGTEMRGTRKKLLREAGARKW